MSPLPNESPEAKPVPEAKDVPKQKPDSPAEKSAAEKAAEKLSKDYAKALRELTEADADYQTCKSKEDMAALLPEKLAARTAALDKLVDLLPPEFALGKDWGQLYYDPWEQRTVMKHPDLLDDREILTFADHLVITGVGYHAPAENSRRYGEMAWVERAIDIQFNPSDKGAPVKAENRDPVKATEAMSLSADLLPFFAHDPSYTLSPNTSDGSTFIKYKGPFGYEQGVSVSKDRGAYSIEGVIFSVDGYKKALADGVKMTLGVLYACKTGNLGKPEQGSKSNPFYDQKGELYFASENSPDRSLNIAGRLDDYSSQLASVLNKIWQDGFQDTVRDTARARKEK